MLNMQHMRHWISKIPLLPTVWSFLKYKALKIGLKIAFLIGILWYFSDSWIGKKLSPIASWAGKDVLSFGATLLVLVKTITATSVLTALVLVILGRPIWRWLYVVIGIGGIVSLVEHLWK